jgi:hypothetical protein
MLTERARVHLGSREAGYGSASASPHKIGSTAGWRETAWSRGGAIAIVVLDRRMNSPENAFAGIRDN